MAWHSADACGNAATVMAVPRACITDVSVLKRTLSSSFKKSSAQRVGAMQATMAAQPCSLTRELVCTYTPGGIAVSWCTSCSKHEPPLGRAAMQYDGNLPAKAGKEQPCLPHMVHGHALRYQRGGA